MPLPLAFDGFVEQSKRVSPTCLITFESNRYSVPASFVNRPVTLRVYPDRLVIAAEGQVLCAHEWPIERSHQMSSQTTGQNATCPEPTMSTMRMNEAFLSLNRLFECQVFAKLAKNADGPIAATPTTTRLPAGQSGLRAGLQTARPDRERSGCVARDFPVEERSPWG
jgi:hypothetical protein